MLWRMRNGGRSPGILDLHHWRWRRAVIFVVEPLYLDRVVADRLWTKDKSRFLTGMEPQFLYRPVSSVVTIVTELSQLNYSVAYQRNSSFFFLKKNNLFYYRNRPTGSAQILGIIFHRCWLNELWVLNCKEFKSSDGRNVCHKVIISLLFLNFVW